MTKLSYMSISKKKKKKKKKKRKKKKEVSLYEVEVNVLYDFIWTYLLRDKDFLQIRLEEFIPII
jgi:hypothetical protein